MQKRNVNFDYLKILSIVLIILFHYFWNSKYKLSSFDCEKKILINIFYMFGELGVNCFALISGYFLSASNKAFRFSKLFNLWTQVLFYSVLSAVVLYANNIHPEPSITYITSIFLPISHNVWWYATAYFLLYIFSPHINKVLNQYSKKEHKNLLLVLLIIFCFIPTILGTISKTTESYLYYSRFIWLTVLYVFAAYIRRFDINIFKKYNVSSKQFLWLAIHLATWLLLIIYIAVFEINPNIVKNTLIIDAKYFWRPNTIIMLILSVTLFMFFKECNLKGGKLLNFLSSSTFGIYLIHGGRNGTFWWNRIFHNAQYEGTYHVFIDAFISLFTIFICGLIVEFIRQSITKLIIKTYSKCKTQK